MSQEGIVAALLATPDSEIVKILYSFTGHDLDSLLNFTAWPQLAGSIMRGESTFWDFEPSQSSHAPSRQTFRFAWNSETWDLTVLRWTPNGTGSALIEAGMLHDPIALYHEHVIIRPWRIQFEFGRYLFDIVEGHEAAA